MDGTLKLTTDVDTGDLLYEQDTGKPPVVAADSDHFTNLAEQLTPTVVSSLCAMMIELVDYDERGRSEWQDIATDAYKLLGIGPESRSDITDEDGGGDTSDHPLMLTALTRFQSKALAALLPSGHEAVRTESARDLEQIEDPKEREAAEQMVTEAGRRVAKFYTNYLFEELDSYETDTDQILHECGMQGMGIRKVFVDRTRNKTPVNAVHVPASDIILSYDAKTFRCGRITHRMNMPTSELIRMLQTKQYRQANRLSPEAPDKTDVEGELDRIVGLGNAELSDTASHRIYEIHCDLILREDPHPLGLARPYIVTIHATSNEVLSVVRNWEPGDEDEQRIEHFVCYPFSPGKTATTPLGLGHILSNITRALRDAQRAGLDAGYLQNHPSGFKLSSFKIRDEATKIRMGEFVDVDSPTDDIRKALQLHPFEGPSQGLMALATHLEENGKELGGVATIDFAAMMKANIAAGPAMAAYEESTVFQTAIHRRLYKAHATELRLIHERMRQIHGNRPVLFGTDGQLQPGDLIMVNILPAMKPGQASKQKNVLEAQAIWDLAKENPDIIDKRKAGLQFLRAIGESNLDDLLLPDPTEEEVKPLDPVSEYSSALAGRPIKAGIMQNHQAHIDAHAAQMQGLQFSSLPVEQGDATTAALAAHIGEHMAMQMMVQVSARVGIDPSVLGEEMPPELESQLSPQIAMAIQQIEAERAAAKQPPGEDKIAIEQAKGEVRTKETQLKGQQAAELEELKHRHALELQKQKDEAQMEREEADNEAALEVAGMKNTIRSNASAGTSAGAAAGTGARAVASAGSGETK